MTEILAWMGEHPILTFFFFVYASRLFHFVRVEHKTDVRLKPERRSDDD